MQQSSRSLTPRPLSLGLRRQPDGIVAQLVHHLGAGEAVAEAGRDLLALADRLLEQMGPVGERRLMLVALPGREVELLIGLVGPLQFELVAAGQDQRAFRAEDLDHRHARDRRGEAGVERRRRAIGKGEAGGEGILRRADLIHAVRIRPQRQLGAAGAAGGLDLADQPAHRVDRMRAESADPAAAQLAIPQPAVAPQRHARARQESAPSDVVDFADRAVVDQRLGLLALLLLAELEVEQVDDAR